MHSQAVAEDRQANGVKNKSQGRKGKEKEKARGQDEGFVDIIAGGGQEWIRIYRQASRSLNAVKADVTARNLPTCWPSSVNKIHISTRITIQTQMSTSLSALPTANLRSRTR